MTFGWLVLSCANALAQLPPSGPELPNFDKRIVGESPAATSAGQFAAIASNVRVPEAKIDFDERTGTPKWITSARGFLTGPVLQSAGSGQAAVLADDHRATRAFISEYREFFGFGPEILAGARVKRDAVTPHTGLRTMVWQQEVEGIPVFEGLLISHTTKRDELVNLSSQFIPNPEQAAEAGTPGRAAMLASPTIPAAGAVALAAQNIGEQLEEVNVSAVEAQGGGVEQSRRFTATPLSGDAEVRLIWLPLGKDSMRLCWDVTLTSRARGEMYRSLVDVEDGTVWVRHRLTEYISDASYRVFLSDSPSPFSPGCDVPCTTQPPVIPAVLVTLSALSTNASPSGWIDDGVNETRGNNVDAHTDRDANNSPDLPRPQGSPFRVFDFTANLAQEPVTYTNAAVTDLFYWCNWTHDRLYELGFTEAAGNFQNNNFGRGGLGNDALQADAQDGSGVNNANMSTPTDGSPPRMQMFVFTGPTPDRDGDFDHEIVIHEYVHGLSNRRVGGGGGLSALQSRGMGEGWSDWYGLALLSEPGDDLNGAYAAGAYATYLLSGLTTNYYFGIRRYPYSTDMSKNPLTFRDIDPGQASTHQGVPRSPIIGTTADEVHNSGEVWSVTLWDARANLIAKHGHAVGNELILRLVTDGMNLAPSNPNFLQARDGILQASMVYDGGSDLPELWAAFAKRGMGRSATSPSSSTTVGLVEAFDVPDTLFISPLNVAVSGSAGGPFSPSSVSFMLSNSGASNLTWSLVSTSAWFVITPTGGTIATGGPATMVTATLLPSAGALSGGSHVSAIVFSNQTTRVTKSGSLTIHVVGLRVADDFDPGLDLSQWSAFGGVVGSTVLATNYGGFISAPNSLWFGDDQSRFATTIPVNTSGGGGIGFALRFGNGAAWPWETADLPGEGVVLESSINNGGTWQILSTHNTTAYQNWTTVTSAIPVAARGPAVLFRWRQLSHSGSSFDHWALENVVINAQASAVLALTVPPMAMEGDAPVAVTVTASPAPTNNLTVNLASLDVTEVSVPASVVIPTGQSNAVFNLTIVNDAELDGVQNAQITAAAAGYSSTTAWIAVLDNETASLAVTLPASALEGDGAVSASITVSAAPTANISVNLSSSDTSEIQVPASVMLQAGQTSAVFGVTIVNDTQIDGDQLVTVSAQVTNWTAGAASILVRDNETTNLAVTLPVSAREGDGVLVGAGAVRISGTLPTNLVVSLSSSDTTELIVPATALISAGQTSGSFNPSVVNDPDIDSSQIVFVTASAPGFANGVTNITITDNESPKEPFSPFPAHLATNVIQTSDLAWQSGAVFGEIITNEVYFGTNPTPGPAELLGSTTGTNWVLPTLSPQTTYFWQIVARKTGVTPGPVWQFTTRGVDYFLWNTIASPQYAGEPFAVKVTAKDAFATTVSNFTGSVNLTASSGGQTTTNTLLPSPLHTTIGSGTFTLAYAFTPSVNLTVTHVRSYSGTKVSIWSDNGNLLASQNVNGVAGSWTDTPLASPLPLVAGTTYRVSFFTGGGNYYFRSGRPSTFPNGTIVNGFYYTASDAFPSTFDSSDTTIFLCDLRYTAGSSQSVPVTPVVSGAFANGSWMGQLTVMSPISNVVLRAEDGGGHVGSSSAFTVGLRNDIGVKVSDTPDPVSLGGNVTYAISITNIGPATANGVMLTNVLPANALAVSVSTSQGSVATYGNVIVCSLNAMAGNTSATVTIVASALGLGTLTNQTFISRSDTDPYLANNSAVVTTAVQSPVISINDVSVQEGNSGMVSAVFTVTVAPPPALTTSVNFATANGSAVAPGDYASTNGTLTFAAGETNRSVVVRVVGDRLYELNEMFEVNLSGATNATIADSQGIGEILNDDSMPMISIGDAVLVEGNIVTTNAVFAVTLSAVSGLDVAVYFGTTDGNTTSGSDYVYLNDYLVIPAGSMGTNVVVTVNGDLEIESDEVFYVDLWSAANAILLKREGYGLILNDDGLPGYVDHFAWSTIDSPQYINYPFGVTITALDVFNNPVVNYGGPARLSVGNAWVTNTTGNDTAASGFPMYTAAHDERTQVIYPAGELGGAGPISALALDVDTIPGLTMSNWTIRIKHTPLTSYSSYVWESSGWTVVHQTNLTVTSSGWLVFPFATPFNYDGSNSLMIDFSFDNSDYSGAGYCRSTSQGSIRTLYYYDYSYYGDPLTWSGNVPSPYSTSYTPNLQLIREGQLVPFQPLATGSFTNGVWAGSLTVLDPATNLVLRVDDRDGHVGNSGAFEVSFYNDIGVSVTDTPDPVAVGGALSYLISATNSGPSAATGVVVVNVLPPNVTPHSVTQSQGSYLVFGQMVIFTFGTINGGSQATASVGVTAAMAGVITNFAIVSRAEPDNWAGNNAVTNTTTVVMPALVINDANIDEPNGTTSNMLFTVTLSPASANTVTVNYATANGSALAGLDYVATNGTVSFAPGQTNRTVAVSVFDDAISEPNETFMVNLTGPVNAVVGRPAGTGTIFDNDGPPEFQIAGLFTSNSRVVDHDAQTSDDRGGIAISTSQAFVTGDGATARFNASDLSGGISLGSVRDSLCVDLRSETVYALGNGSNPLTSSGGTVTTLIELNGATGSPTGVIRPLSQSFSMPSYDNGIFSGYGRVVVHNGTSVYDINVQTGTVTLRGTMTRPSWYPSESWSVWGVAEYFGGTLYLAYRENGTQRIVRARVPDGQITAIASFSNLSDMASFVVSPSRNRWYFHYEGSGQFGGSSETLGYADAQFTYINTNPPVIATQPLNQAVSIGGTAIFNVTASGASPLAYQWRFQGTNLPGQTTTTLTLLNAQSNQVGPYTVVVTNAYGSVTSSIAMLTVLPPGSGIAYLRSSVGAPWGSTSNESALTRVFGAGTWQDLRFETVSPVTLFSPANGFVFMDGSDNGATEMETFLNSNRSLMEGWVAGGGRLFLNSAPNEDNGMYFGFGANLIYSDSTSQGRAALPAHPIFNGPFTPVGTDWTGSSFGHATVTGTNLVVLITNTANGRIVLAQQAYGAGRVLFGGMTTHNFHSPATEAANLRANILYYGNTPLVTSNQPPVITGQPASQTVLAGGVATFAVSATGSAPLFYQWRKNAGGISGATNATFTISGAQTNDAGSYSVIVTNLHGSATSSNAILTVTTNLQLVVGIMAAGNAIERDALSSTLTNLGFTVQLVSQGQWAGLDVVLSYPSVSSFGPSRSEISNGVSFVQISDHGSDWTANAWMSLTQGTIVTISLDTAHPITTGLPASWTTYGFWHYGLLGDDYLGWGIETNLPSLVRAVSPTSQSRLLVADSLGNGRAVYIGWNVYGVDAGPNDVSLLRNAILWTTGQTQAGSQPTITNQPQNQTVTAGGVASMTVGVTGTAPFRYQWRKNTAPIANQTNATFTLPNVQTNDAGVYSVVVTNLFGSVLSSNATLTVELTPSISMQPVSQTIPVGSPATMSILASGSPPLRYQWRKDSIAIMGATNFSYTMNAVQYTNAGGYSVVVSNAYGFTNSSVASLTVVPYSTNISFYAYDTGWYDATGYHFPGNANYLCGDYSSAVNPPLRNWFAFNVPPLPGPVVAAQLRINTYSIVSPTGSEMFQLRHVSTPVAALVAGGSGLISIYGDLADGPIYGDRSLSVAESNQIVTVTLNTSFISNIVAAAGQSFALGGEIASLDGTPSNNEAAFAFSTGAATDVQLLLTIEGSPSQLKFLDPELLAAGLRLRVSTVDGSPITPARASNIWVYATTNSVLPGGNWIALPGTPVLTNGELHLNGINSTNPPARFFRALEVP